MRLERAGAEDQWADVVAAELVARLQAKPALRLCLPTGKTPVPIYDRLANAVAQGRASLAQATVFLLDEFGGVAATDAGRCEMMIRHDLLARVDLPESGFRRFDLGGDVDAECAAYEAAIGLGCDLTLLGIGGNGHIGMNEPGAAADSVTRRVVLDPRTVAASARYFGRDHDLPTWGVTMGVGTILRSKEIWLLANGAGKAAIVAETLGGPVTPAVPASLLRTHGAAVCYADAAAAAGV